MLDILNSLSFGNDFTIEGIFRAVDENKEAKIFGGLTRDQFVENSFFVQNLAALS